VSRAGSIRLIAARELHRSFRHQAPSAIALDPRRFQ
jgi:hypothetical protein